MNARLYWALPLAGFAALVLLTTRCTSPAEGGAQDAGPLGDTGIDAPRDARSEHEASLGDAGDGWRYYTELGPDCTTTKVALDPAKAMPPITWIPCRGKTSLPNCQEIPTDSWEREPGRSGNDFVGTGVSTDHRWFVFARIVTTMVDDQLLYELPDFKPRFVWRHAGPGQCVPYPWIRPSGFLIAMPIGTYKIASGDPEELLRAPNFIELSPNVLKADDFNQSHAASDSTIAMDVMWSGNIIRFKPGHSDYVRTNAVTGTATELQVHGDDVFAWDIHGNGGYAQEVLINLDGTRTVLLAKPNLHIYKFATDGTYMWWLERDAASWDVPGNLDLWVAPYSTDPTQLAGTATKVLRLDTTGKAYGAIANDGVYAVAASEGIAYLVRGSDHALKKLSFDGSSPMIGATEIPYVSQHELWVTVSQKNGPNGVGLYRFDLEAW